jgi:hypothetical protein
LFNKQLSRVKVVIENCFGILKKTFQNLIIKSNLHELFLPNVMIYCCMLHTMIMNGKDMDIDELMQQLEVENVIKNK